MTDGGRLVAINHVELESPRGIENELLWFYGDLLGLDPKPAIAEGDTSVPSLLRFRSEPWELRITLLDEPHVDPVACRAVFEISRLERAAEMLQERRYAFTWHHGLRGTDRSISVIDPGGHRVVIRQWWPWALL